MPQYSYGKTLLKVEDVSLEYDGRPILKHVSAEIRDIICPSRVQGQVVGFLGPSGIGKTQLFRIIAGLNKPTSGRVTINGTSGASGRSRCGCAGLSAVRAPDGDVEPSAGCQAKGKGRQGRARKSRAISERF